MASIEQNPAAAPGASYESGVNPLNALLARVYTLNWEAIFYIVLFAVAILTRFVNLGDRVMSHDESLHTKFSWDLWRTGNFQHTPLMHGPVLFHAVAFFYFLFGDSDFSARLYPAILGIMIVMMPKFLFERWLGKRGAMVGAVLLLISPMILFHNRYIREDTPSIFFTLLMLWAVLRYIDGPKVGQVRWLLVLSGATLLSLASKEVAFMYIAIFGAFLTLYWLFQVLADVRRGVTKPLAGWVIGGVLGFLVAGGVAFLAGGIIGNALGLPRIVFQAGLLLALLFLGLSFLTPIKTLLGNLGDRAYTTFQVVSMGVVIGTVLALILICIVNIIPLSSITKTLPDQTRQTDTALLGNLVVWITTLLLIALGYVMLTAIRAFRGVRRLPWLEIIAMLVIALVVAGALTFFEERSKFTNPTDRQIIPSAIYVTWILGAAACAGLLFLRFRTTFFEEMKRYPTFDVLVVIGTLVLPWATAIPMWIAGYKLDDGYASAELVQAGIMAAVPFIAVAIVGGLCWNERAWIPCAITFYAIFAFFFTTVFTNPSGIISGAIGSLGYWLEQQGVRRGDQPQYYYMITQLPVYEFLPLIGSFVAGAAGLLAFWRFRAARYVAVSIERDTLAAMSASAEPANTEPLSAEVADGLTDADARETHQAAARSRLWEAEAMHHFPFIGFLAFWTGLIVYAFTISGEKMPWLTTHLTLPMIFITAWYLGKVLDQVEWRAFFRIGWLLLLLTPILIIAGANVIGPFAFGQSPLGLSRDQLLTFGGWLFAVLVMGAVGYSIWLIWRRIGWRETQRVLFLGVFLLLGIFTARTAWRFAFIDYDYATEFGVYAHGAPAMRTAMNRIEELSRATTDGLNIKVAYDDDVSWPGSWYFRIYPNARFLGDTSGATDLDQMAAVMISYKHRANVEPQLGDRFYKFDYIRLWWPMEDYKNLTAQRVNNLFIPVENGVDPARLRQGLWDIWWNRDYRAYGSVTGKSFETSQWPVADRMLFYVRKDVAAQVWDLGVGNVSPIALAADPFAKLRCTDCRADSQFTIRGSEPGQLNAPHGLTFGPDGKLYVADTANGRISVFNPDMSAAGQIGTQSTTDVNTVAPVGTLREPWSVALNKDGTEVYVADTWNHRVQVFNTKGDYLRSWGHFERTESVQEGTPDGFFGPRDITLDAEGNVYVADTGNKRIRVYTPTGTLLRTIGTGGSGPGQLNEPVGIVIDNVNKRIYVADTWNKRIQVFTMEGVALANWKVSNWYGPSEDTGNRPFLALDKTGTRLFVTEPDTGRLLVWDVSNVGQIANGSGGEQALLVFASKGNPDANHFQSIGGLVTDATSLWVTDPATGRILRFNIAALPGVLPLTALPVQDQPTLVTVATQPATVQADSGAGGGQLLPPLFPPATQEPTAAG